MQMTVKDYLESVYGEATPDTQVVPGTGYENPIPESDRTTVIEFANSLIANVQGDEKSAHLAYLAKRLLQCDDVVLQLNCNHTMFNLHDAFIKRGELCK